MVQFYLMRGGNLFCLNFEPLSMPPKTSSSFKTGKKNLKRDQELQKSRNYFANMIARRKRTFQIFNN